MIEVKMVFASPEEVVAFFSARGVSAPTAAPVAATAEPKPKKEAPAPAPVAEPAAPPTSAAAAATSPSPAPAASAPAQEPAAPAPAAKAAPTPAPAAAPVAVSYEKSGIPEAMPKYLGTPASEGYAERRAAVVALLKEFDGAATAKALKPEQYAEFLARLQELPQ